MSPSSTSPRQSTPRQSTSRSGAPVAGASTAVRLGLLAWAVQVLALVAELVAASAVTVPYDLVRNTISELGAVTCAEYRDAAGALAVCSPAHVLANGSFVVSGLLVVAGAVLVRPLWVHRGLGRTATALWVVNGLGSVATGLVPLDVAFDLHGLVSIPAGVVLPFALLTTAVALPGRHPRLVATSVPAAVAAAAGTAVFLAGTHPELGGLLERVALWPGTLWLTACAVTLLGRTGQEPE